MRVKDLVDQLLECDPDAFIVINNEVVNSIRQENGRVKKGYMVDGWVPLDRGNKTTVRFTYLEERSDGNIYECNY